MNVRAGKKEEGSPQNISRYRAGLKGEGRTSKKEGGEETCKLQRRSSIQQVNKKCESGCRAKMSKGKINNGGKLISQ